VKTKLTLAVATSAATLVALLLLNGPRVTASLYSYDPPTPAATATSGEPAPAGTTPPLAQPLVTQAQALEQALRVDAIWSVWDHPWSKDTLQLEPGRITLKAFPSQTAESAEAGRNEWFAPDIDADGGAVWRVTIKGRVHVDMLSMRVRSIEDAAKYDGVTYVISQRTGNLLAVMPF
jgi:hypothetical protein